MKGKILVLEPNAFHGEVVLGVVHYFEILGYQVDVYLRKEVIKEKYFIHFLKKVSIHEYQIDEIVNILKSEEICKYDYLFLTSMEFLYRGEVIRFLDHINFMPATKKGILGIYHTVSHIESFHDWQMLKENRIFCLSEFSINGISLQLLNPHYFGDNLSKQKGKEKIELVVVGVVLDRKWLDDTVVDLWESGHRNFIIRCIGGKQKSYKVILKHMVKRFLFTLLYRLYPSSDVYYKKRIITKHIVEIGRVSFPKMSGYLRKASFIISMLNSNKQDLVRYCNDTTTGTKQLLLGYNLPGIMQKEFAEAYGLSSSNTIVFEGEDLKDALCKAITMESKEYIKMKSCLSEFQKEIEKKSLINLKKLLNND